MNPVRNQLRVDLESLYRTAFAACYADALQLLKQVRSSNLPEKKFQTFDCEPSPLSFLRTCLQILDTAVSAEEAAFILLHSTHPVGAEASSLSIFAARVRLLEEMGFDAQKLRDQIVRVLLRYGEHLNVRELPRFQPTFAAIEALKEAHVPAT